MDDDHLKPWKEEKFGPWRVVSKKQAAHRQIMMAVVCVMSGDWESAITLAGAAEGQIEDMPNAKTPSMFTMWKERKPESKSEREHIALLNGRRDWLKHNGDQGEQLICEIEAMLMVGRAMGKYWNAFQDNEEEINAFGELWRKKGYPKAT